MMAIFDLVTNPPPEVAQQYSDATDAIAAQYFTVDTASADEANEWSRFNRHMVTYALYRGEVLGFFNVIPLTEECGKLFERQAIKEEDLTVEHILPRESLRYAQYAYIAAIAVKDTRNFVSRQCVAALLSGMADLLLNGYKPEYFRRILANPTTFQGNKIVRRLGLKPLNPFKKPLAENDVYAADINEETRLRLDALSTKYTRFTGKNPWRERSKD